MSTHRELFLEQNADKGQISPLLSRVHKSLSYLKSKSKGGRHLGSFSPAQNTSEFAVIDYPLMTQGSLSPVSLASHTHAYKKEQTHI